MIVHKNYIVFNIVTGKTFSIDSNIILCYRHRASPVGRTLYIIEYTIAAIAYRNTIRYMYIYIIKPDITPADGLSIDVRTTTIIANRTREENYCQ